MIGTHLLARVRFAGLALLALALGSCTRKPSLYPVHGRLFVNDQPAAGALIVFNPVVEAKPRVVRPYGQVDERGDFSVSSFNVNDGAPAGEYILTVQWRRKRNNPFEADGPDKLQGRYGDASSSQLKVRVEPKPTELEPIHLSTDGAK